VITMRGIGDHDGVEQMITMPWHTPQLQWALPFSCPLGATRDGQGRQREAQSETRNQQVLPIFDARSGCLKHRAAKRG